MSQIINNQSSIINSPARWHLRLSLTLIFLGLLSATTRESWQGWNLLGNAVGFTVSAAILYCVYLGSKLWIWFLRVILGLFALAIIIGTIQAPQHPLTVKFGLCIATLAYTLWVLCFAKSVKHHWRRMRKS